MNYTPAQEMVLKRELHKEEVAAGVFEPAPVPYLIHGLFFLVVIGVCVYLLMSELPWYISWVLIPLAVAFAKTQLAFDNHDAGHNQIFKRKRANELVMRASTFILGLVGTLWVKSHNAHHRHPNHLERDPNVLVPIYTFDSSQGTGLFRRHQAKYYFLTVPLVIPMMRWQGVAMLLQRKTPDWWLELLGMVFYAASSIIFLVWALGPWGALVFALVQEYALGLYLGSVFASNHKGMRMVKPGEKLGILTEQLETSRDIKSWWWTSFLMGGLNNQSVHHVFSSISRWRSDQATDVLVAFCNKHDLYYCRTGFFQAYKDILGSLETTAHGEFSPQAA